MSFEDILTGMLIVKIVKENVDQSSSKNLH